MLLYLKVQSFQVNEKGMSVSKQSVGFSLIILCMIGNSEWLWTQATLMEMSIY